jgi:hypothetical protein
LLAAVPDWEAERPFAAGTVAADRLAVVERHVDELVAAAAVARQARFAE